MTRYPYLLFDADNTLFCFDEANRRSFRAICEKFGLPDSQDFFDRFEAINNATWERFDRGELTKDETVLERFRLFLAAEGISGIDPAECNRIHLEHLSNSTYLMPHAEEVVAALRREHHVYLITNAVAAVQRGRLGRSALAPYVEEAFISETAGAAKPSVKYFDYVFAHIEDITKENCLVIGDSLTSDIQGANNYGLPCCWYNPKRVPKPATLRVDYEIRDLRELYAILGADPVV